ncbi:MAG: hypothetical protein L0I62_06875 [Gammaproteobacteria bacterium]|nr:hypothetical protein [Gammaproteobacteria bacterium]
MKRMITGVLLAAAIALPLSLISAPTASAGVSISISVGYAPPLLPWYPQPPCTGYGYYWVPGYWGWGPYGYYWIPGAWVYPPVVGFLWTPGYWGWWGGRFWWHPGYWGIRVGFYGGIPYGYGYNGYGYHGGRWHGGRFHYNRAVTNLEPSTLDASYNQPVKHRVRQRQRMSYNGGSSGVQRRPTTAQKSMLSTRHLKPTQAQLHLVKSASENPALRFSNNGGHPSIVEISQLTHASTLRAKREDRLASLDDKPATAHRDRNGPGDEAVFTAKPPVMTANPRPTTSPPGMHKKPPVMTANPRPTTSPPGMHRKPPVMTANPRPTTSPPGMHRKPPVAEPQPPTVRHPPRRRPSISTRPRSSTRPHRVRHPPSVAPRHDSSIQRLQPKPPSRRHARPHRQSRPPVHRPTTQRPHRRKARPTIQHRRSAPSVQRPIRRPTHHRGDDGERRR